MFRSAVGGLLALALSLPCLADRSKRMEDLFIWKVSDELKFNSMQERKFSEIYRSLNQKKASTQGQIDLDLKKMKNDSEKEKKEALSHYQKHLKEFNDIAVLEVEEMRKTFGVTLASRYILLKQELAEQIRSAFREQVGGGEAKVLPEPIVRERPPASPKSK